MKSKLTVLAMALFFLAQTASAQQSRDHGRYNNDRDRNTQLGNDYNSDRNAPDYGTRRVKTIIGERS